MNKIDNVRDLADEVNEALGALRNLSSVHDSVAYNGVLDVLLWTNLPLLLGGVEKLRGEAARSDADHRTMDARATELEGQRHQLRRRAQLLNVPMVAKLRQCAADDSPNRDTKINIRPPEAHQLLALIDAAIRSAGVAAAPEFLIWSHHHKAWFGPTGAGYYRDITDAGRYALEDTKPWLGRGCGCCAVPEVVIPAPPASVLAAPGQTREWTAKRIKEATDARFAAGQVNKFAAVPAEAADQSR